jgi:catechol 2,3-dioxygenase-like lactoylglutathione lyase family enzyme
MARFLGVDHIDVRVRSLLDAEPFYDRLLPPLGLVRKTHSVVDHDGSWADAEPGGPHNVAEYFEEGVEGAPRFLGVIEDSAMASSQTRIALRVASREALLEWAGRLHAIGAQNVEVSEDLEAYAAIFFEDPCGTRLELCARTPR